MRILVIEDEARLAAFLAKGLSELSFTVDVAEDGPTALHRARAPAPLGAPDLRLRKEARDAGDLDDAVSIAAALPAQILGGEGDDRIAGGDGDADVFYGMADSRIGVARLHRTGSAQ